MNPVLIQTRATQHSGSDYSRTDAQSITLDQDGVLTLVVTKATTGTNWNQTTWIDRVSDGYRAAFTGCATPSTNCTLTTWLPAGTYNIYLGENSWGTKFVEYDVTFRATLTPGASPLASGTIIAHPTVATSRAIYDPTTGLKAIEWGGKPWFTQGPFYGPRPVDVIGDAVRQYQNSNPGRTWDQATKSFNGVCTGFTWKVKYFDFADTGDPNVIQVQLSITNTSSGNISYAGFFPLFMDGLRNSVTTTNWFGEGAAFGVPMGAINFNDICISFSCDPDPRLIKFVGKATFEEGGHPNPHEVAIWAGWGSWPGKQPYGWAQGLQWTLAPGQTETKTVTIRFHPNTTSLDFADVPGGTDALRLWGQQYVAEFGKNYAPQFWRDRRPVALNSTTADWTGLITSTNVSGWRGMPSNIDLSQRFNDTQYRAFRNWFINTKAKYDCDYCIRYGCQTIIYWELSGNPVPLNNGRYHPDLWVGYIFCPELRWVDPLDPGSGTTLQAFCRYFQSRGVRIGSILQGSWNNGAGTGWPKQWCRVNGGPKIRPHEVPAGTDPATVTYFREAYTSREDFLSTIVDIMDRHQREFGIIDYYYDVNSSALIEQYNSTGRGVCDPEMVVIRDRLMSHSNGALQGVRLIGEYQEVGSVVSGAIALNTPPGQTSTMNRLMGNVDWFEVGGAHASVGIPGGGRCDADNQSDWTHHTLDEWVKEIRNGGLPGLQNAMFPNCFQAYAIAYGGINPNVSSLTVNLDLCQGMDRVWCDGLAGATHSIDWGDGRTTTLTGPVLTASHTYASPGNYTIKQRFTPFPNASAAAGIYYDATATVTTTAVPESIVISRSLRQLAVLDALKARIQPIVQNNARAMVRTAEQFMIDDWDNLSSLKSVVDAVYSSTNDVATTYSRLSTVIDVYTDTFLQKIAAPRHGLKVGTPSATVRSFLQAKKAQYNL